MNRAASAAAVSAALLSGALALQALWRFMPSAIARELPRQPVPVPTAWGGFGALLTAALLAALAVGAVFYLRTISPRNDLGPWRSPWIIAGWSAIAIACAWCAPAIFSSDVYAYAAYGELARLGANPYVHQRLPPGNALYAAAVVQWGNPIPACVYGLPFVAVAAAVSAIASPLGAAASLNGLRLVSSIALVASAPVAFAAFGGDRARRCAAAATIALNPVALWCAAEGHNDALAVTLALGGFALFRGGRLFAGATLAAAAGAIKLPGVLAATPLALRNRRAAWGMAAGAVLTVLCSLPLLAGVVRIGPAPHYAPQASLQALVAALAAPLGVAPATCAAWVVAGAGAAACGAAAWQRLRRDDAEGWAYAAAGGWLLVPNPYPWYGLWLLPIAAAVPGTRAAAALIGLSLVSALRYLPDAAAAPAAAGAIALSVAATLPVLALFCRRRLV